jgi:hypothetical protein
MISSTDVHNISFNHDPTNVLLFTLFATDIICGNSLTSGCTRGGAKKKAQVSDRKHNTLQSTKGL